VGVKCSFKALTGLDCAGCGGQRAFHFLLHGEFLQALRYNFLIFFLPFFLYLIYVIVEVYIFKDKKYLSGFMFSNKLGIMVIVVVLAYTVLRNIPYEPFIYLAPPK
jgi:chromate transport protein ChrA